MTRIRIAVLAMASGLVSLSAAAQPAKKAKLPDVPGDAQSLVVAVRVLKTKANSVINPARLQRAPCLGPRSLEPTDPADRETETGAGIVIAVDANDVYIATAKHVVAAKAAFNANDTARTWIQPDSLFVKFWFPGADTTVSPSSYRTAGQAILLDSCTSGAEGATARAARTAASTMDLALIRVPRASIDPRWVAPRLDRLGNVDALLVKDEVSSMGCPNFQCWVRHPRDLLAAVPVGAEMQFQSQYLGQGASGGALFNEWWEVVGMIERDNGTTGYAITMHEALDAIRASGANVQAQLARPSLPRDGYHTSIDVQMLTPIGSEAAHLGPDKLPLPDETRLPSGRVTLTLRGRSPFTLHASVLRLAPNSTAVTAALGGVGLKYRPGDGRFSTHVYGELGFGHVVSRYDAGGYYVLPSSPAGQPAYHPLWTQELGSSVGVGGGFTMEYVVAPHIGIALNAAKWAFDKTSKGLPLPAFFAGAGLVWSR